MKPSLLDVPFPLRGLVVNVAKDKQPPLTAAAAVNVRGYDPVAGRDRGGQRSGLTKYCPTSFNYPIQDINHLSTSLSAPVGSTTGQILYTPGATNALGIGLNASGTFSVIAGKGATPDQMNVSIWDQAGNGYAALTGGTTGRLVLYKLSATGTTAWTINHTLSASSVTALGIATDGTYLYVHMKGTAGGFGFPIYRFNVSDGTMNGPGSTFWYKGIDAGVASVLLGNNTLAYASGMLAMAGGAVGGGLQLIVTATAHLSYDVTLGDPIFDIDTDGYNFFYAVTKAAHAANLYKVALGGTAVKSQAIGDDCVSICFDPVNTVLAAAFTAPGPGYSVATFNINTLALIASATPNATQWDTIRVSGAGGYFIASKSNTFVMGISASLVSTTMTLVALQPGPLTIKSVIGVNSVAAVATTPALSSSINLAVSAGTVIRFTSSGIVASGLGAITFLNPAAPVIFSTQLQSRMYYADGSNYVYYDPATNTTLQLVASAGSLPTDAYGNTGRLLCTWRQRLVIAGLPRDGSNWFMSATNAPTDFNYSPSPPVETQAVAGNLTTAGQTSDVITCLIPYNDEVLILGQANSIFQMTGDPASGGRIDLVTDQVGMAWGQPWCRDGQGVLYFLSARGSVYKFVPGAIPERMSDPISELLTGAIDFSTTIARMVWDERQLGFHLFLTKQGGAAAATHYFWDQRNDAWWQDVYANNNHNPLAAHALQGFTAADRVVLIGGQDGYIRCADCAAKDDDGTAISSSVTLGPIKDKNAVGLTTIDLQADLDTASDAVSWSIIRGNDAQTALIAPALFSGTFSAGRNRSQPVRAFGHATYIVLSSNTIAKRWALEYLRVKVLAAEGTDRQRMFVA